MESQAIHERMEKMSNFQIPQPSIAGGPTIEFAFHGDVVTAELAGAKLRAERIDDEHADLRLHDATGKVLASVEVRKLSPPRCFSHATAAACTL